MRLALPVGYARPPIGDDDHDFPDQWLTPKLGGLRGPDEDGLYGIEIPLEPFDAGLGGIEETSIRLEQIAFHAASAADLSEREFSFPVNPNEGYIDGSIYLTGAHNPVDVTRISFGRLEEDKIEATLTMRLLFEFEGSGFADRDAELTAVLQIHP
jgi:hypothetical protein